MAASPEFIEAVRKGEDIGKIDYSSWDQAQQKLEDDRMKRAMEDFSKTAYEGDYASAVDEGVQYGLWGITSRTLKDVFDTNKDALKEDRKSTRLNPVTNAHLVCRLLLEKKNK